MKRSKRFNKAIFGIAMALFLGGSALAQTITDLSFLDVAQNNMQNVTYLEPFFEKLYALKNGTGPTVNILHIGDSHIQADFLTDVVRRNLQGEFGNAGRGLVVPARVAGTNEPSNIRSYSSSTWTAKRVVHPANPLPIGIGGITINTEKDGTSFYVKMNARDVDYSFNSVSIFSPEDAGSFDILLTDSLASVLGRFSTGERIGTHATRLSLPSFYDHVGFLAVKQQDQQRHATVFGLSFENGKRGVLYHAVGVNGAKYEHYNAAQYFSAQAAYLNPDVIIISLGTNESVETPYYRKDFIAEVTKLLDALQKTNPSARFILVTPPDAFLKKIKVNPNIETIRQKILQIAVERGIAFWDMYKVNGGQNSAAEWKMKGLLRPDGVHFSKDGYALQGKLLFEAIMNGYNAYVADRHP